MFSGPDVSKLKELRQLQKKVKLDDEVVVEPVRTKLREEGEVYIQKALEIQTARTRIKYVLVSAAVFKGVLCNMKGVTDWCDCVPARVPYPLGQIAVIVSTVATMYCTRN